MLYFTDVLNQTLPKIEFATTSSVQTLHSAHLLSRQLDTHMLNDFQPAGANFYFPWVSEF